MAAISTAFTAIGAEAGLELPTQRRALEKAFIRLSWRGYSKQTVIDVLGCQMLLINQYRHAVPSLPDGLHPIHEARTFNLA